MSRLSNGGVRRRSQADAMCSFVLKSSNFSSSRRDQCGRKRYSVPERIVKLAGGAVVVGVKQT